MDKKVKIAEGGPVEIRGQRYSYHLLSDAEFHYIKVFTPGGKEIEFRRNTEISLKEDMETALVSNGIIPEGGYKR
ncbi:MAG TPA: hypothetical protein VJY62_19785 [Bacteroidia bacterium]|nr:hypothetical protein [Bacteroidia bacterium]